jgi:hypothetical protein
VLLRELGDVDEALDALEDLDEGAERDDLGDRALELVAHVVGVDDPLPRVLLGLLEAQGDPLPVAVDVEHLDLHGVPDGEDLRRVVDVRPRELGDVDQAVDAVQVHERAEVDDVRDLALDDEAGLQPLQDRLALLLALLLEHGAPREHDVVARAVELDDLALDVRAEVLVEVRDAADVDQRGGQEAAHPEIDDEAALDHLDDAADDGLAGLGGRLDRRQARSKRARFFERISRPSGSSLVRTRASTSSPSSTSSEGSTDFRMESSLEGMTPSDL